MIIKEYYLENCKLKIGVYRIFQGIKIFPVHCNWQDSQKYLVEHKSIHVSGPGNSSSHTYFV